MPSSTPELRAKWGLDPFAAMTHLDRNYTIDRGLIRPIDPRYRATIDDNSAVTYLVHEWDFWYEHPSYREREEC